MEGALELRRPLRDLEGCGHHGPRLDRSRIDIKSLYRKIVNDAAFVGISTVTVSPAVRSSDSGSKNVSSAMTDAASPSAGPFPTSPNGSDSGLHATRNAPRNRAAATPPAVLIDPIAPTFLFGYLL